MLSLLSNMSAVSPTWLRSSASNTIANPKRAVRCNPVLSLGYLWDISGYTPDMCILDVRVPAQRKKPILCRTKMNKLDHISDLPLLPHALPSAWQHSLKIGFREASLQIPCQRSSSQF
jgi:hypothetical protein